MTNSNSIAFKSQYANQGADCGSFKDNIGIAVKALKSNDISAIPLKVSIGVKANISSDCFAIPLGQGVWLPVTTTRPKVKKVGGDIFTSYAKGEPVDLTVPDGYRALIVGPNHEGGYITQTVSNGDSVFDIRTELIKHLEELPLSDDWLLELRGWINRRLEFRERARERREALKALQEAQL